MGRRGGRMIDEAVCVCGGGVRVGRRATSLGQRRRALQPRSCRPSAGWGYISSHGS
jgi:hypothetical protein